MSALYEPAWPERRKRNEKKREWVRSNARKREKRSKRGGDTEKGREGKNGSNYYKLPWSLAGDLSDYNSMPTRNKQEDGALSEDNDGQTVNWKRVPTLSWNFAKSCGLNVHVGPVPASLVCSLMVEESPPTMYGFTDIFEIYLLYEYHQKLNKIINKNFNF